MRQYSIFLAVKYVKFIKSTFVFRAVGHEYDIYIDPFWVWAPEIDQKASTPDKIFKKKKNQKYGTGSV